MSAKQSRSARLGDQKRIRNMRRLDRFSRMYPADTFFTWERIETRRAATAETWLAIDRIKASFNKSGPENTFTVWKRLCGIG